MEPDEFAEIARKLDRACEEAGRPALRKGIQLRTDDPSRSKEQVQRFADAGASTVVFVLDAEVGADSVRRLADGVL
jgi:hypothetical protein